MRKQTKIAALVSAAALLAIGASMTSLAATGWVETSEGEYQWLDAYGDPVYDEWKTDTKDGVTEWFYLGEDGYMLKDQIFTDTEDHTFCVDADGKRLTSEWLQLDNVDSLDVNNDGEEESVLWMYFQDNGRAIKASSGDYFTAKEVEWSGGKNVFLFNEDGYMLSGWVMKDGAKPCRKVDGETVYGDLIYYLGSENEGWARTGWQEINMPFDHVCPDQKNTHWFYFDSTGRAYVKEDGEKYIGNKDGVYRWYSFGKDNEDTMIKDAILREGWTDYSDYGDAYNATAATPPASETQIYNGTNGSEGYGWIYTSDVSTSTCFDDTHVSNDSGSHWYYLVTYRDNTNRTANPVVRSIPFNYGMTEKAAKSINGKIYLFDTKGRMMYGLTVLDTPTATTMGGVFSGIKVVTLQPGIYYFNDPEDAKKSTAGQMTTGRVTLYDEDDNTVVYNYNFAKKEVKKYDANGTDTNLVFSQGAAYKNAIVDGSFYDGNGRRVDAVDGNSYQVYKPTGTVWVVKSGKATPLANSGNGIIVSSSGRVKASGTVRIDGWKYTIKNSVISTVTAD